MTYAIQSDLEERMMPDLLVTLTDDNEDEAADTAVIEAALEDASAEIDQALARRYVTPIDPAPDILRRWCVDLAMVNLFLRKKHALPSEHAARAELTRRVLEAISGGMTGLVGAQPTLDALESENTQRGETSAFRGESLEEY